MKILNFRMKVYFSLIFLFSCLVALCNVKQPFIAKDLLDYALLADYEKMKSNIILLLITIGCLLFFELLRKFLTATYKKQLYVSLRQNILEGLFKKTFEEFYKHNNQEYVSLLNNDLRDIVDGYYMQFLDLLFDFFSIIIYSVSLFTLHPLMAVIVIVTNILPMIIPLLFERKLQIGKLETLERLRKYNVRFGDVVNGFALIKAHGIQDIVKNKLGQASENSAESEKKYENMNSKSEMIIGFFSFANYFCIIILGAYLISKGLLTAGGLLAAMTVSELLVGPVTNVSYKLNGYNAIKKIKKQIFNEYNTRNHKSNTIPLDENIYKIEIKDLNFGYNGLTALNDINIIFESNKKYLVYGLNGSGKSTLFKILAKIYCNYKGDILINGKELRNIENNSYYNKIGIIFQKPFMFNDTLKDNITLYSYYSEEKIKNVIHAMSLQRIERDVFTGKEYKDSENNISGGEIQKIALCRLLLEQKKFIFLDEATSAFDAESSVVIESSLLKDKELTIINIEHKVNKELIQYYDEIICLEKGQVVKILKTEKEKDDFVNVL